MTVGRVIVFGGSGNTMQDLYNAEEREMINLLVSQVQNLRVMKKIIIVDI